MRTTYAHSASSSQEVTPGLPSSVQSPCWINLDAEPQCSPTRLCPPELRLTSYGTLSTNTPEKALRTRKNTINQSAVTTSASGRFVGEMKM